MNSPDRLPTLVGANVTIRPVLVDELDDLIRVRTDPSVTQWWGTNFRREELLKESLGDDPEVVLLLIEVDGVIAGGIEYHEELDPEYQSAGIDIYLAERYQGRGLGGEAVRLLARWLIYQRGFHRLTIDPAAANTRAIRAYSKVGFKPVGIMRQYERGSDGTYHDGLLMDILASELK